MSKNNPSDKISVVVAIYNIENCLRSCIESILNQTYENLEIVLVDDGSTDASGEICDSYAKSDKRIVTIHKKNGGLSDARNSGIDIAKGRFITFIDGDDTIEKDYVSTLYDTIISDNSDISIAGHNIVRQSGIVKKCASKHKVYSPEDALREILYDREIDLSAWGKLYKTSLFEKIRYPKGKLYEDSATTYRLFDAAKAISVIPKTKYNYIIRSTSITNEAFNPRKFELITSTSEMCEYVTSKYPSLAKAAERRMMWAHLSTLAQLSNAKKPKHADIDRLMGYIKTHRKAVLSDENISKRDRLSLQLTKLGFRGFCVAWKLYKRGRK